MINYTAARHNMVLSQLEPNRVTDPAILAAMGAVPRERFVPAPLAGVAYVDEDVEIAAGRYLMEPRVLGRLLQEARVQPREAVLDIGGGTGYSAAVLARLANTVVALEEDADLAARASQHQCLGHRCPLLGRQQPAPEGQHQAVLSGEVSALAHQHRLVGMGPPAAGAIDAKQQGRMDFQANPPRPDPA